MGENTLKKLYPSLFRLSNFKSQPISTFLDGPRLQVEGTTSWNFHFPRNLLDREIEQLQELLHRVERIRLRDTIEDKGEWLVDSSGMFLCKLAFRSLTGDDSRPVNYSAKSI